MREPRCFIQVLVGPRQTGKTTLARQLMERYTHAVHYASADALAAEDRQWIRQQWEVIHLRLTLGKSDEGLLILADIQKIPDWSSVVKSLWDEDSGKGIALKSCCSVPLPC